LLGKMGDLRQVGEICNIFKEKFKGEKRHVKKKGRTARGLCVREVRGGSCSESWKTKRLGTIPAGKGKQKLNGHGQVGQVRRGGLEGSFLPICQEYRAGKGSDMRNRGRLARKGGKTLGGQFRG